MTCFDKLKLVVAAVCLTVPACSTGNVSSPQDDSKIAGEQKSTYSETPKGLSTESQPAAVTPKLIIGKYSQIGKFWEFNNDAIAVTRITDATLCLLAHGMGGKVKGKVLGQAACERAFDVLTRELKDHLPPAGVPEKCRQVIRQATVAANQTLMEIADEDRESQVLGATIALTLYRPPNDLYVAGLGDVRVYLLRDAKLQQLTVDHMLAQAFVMCCGSTWEPRKWAKAPR
jgi:hypothetical protein